MSYAVLTIPGAALISPSSVVIDEGGSQHDLATLHMEDDTVIREHIGAPAVLEIFDGPMQKKMYGYIDTGVAGRYSTGHDSIYYLLGASSVMRSGSPKMWRDQTPFEIAKQIV